MFVTILRNKIFNCYSIDIDFDQSSLTQIFINNLKTLFGTIVNKYKVRL